MQTEEQPDSNIRQRRRIRYISLICILLIVGALVFLLYYHIIQPYQSERTTDKYRNIYHYTEDTGTNETSEDTGTKNNTSTIINDTVVTQETKILTSHLTWDELATYNEDICGWITMPNTNIDYPVVQSSDEQNSNYYLTHNLDGDEDKNGCLFADYRTQVGENPKNIVINGHNMKSTGLMFHDLANYNDLDFYKDNPVFTFNTPLEDAQWKIFALIKTNNNKDHGIRFDYFQNDFATELEFLNFVYQLELRSIYSYPVTVNEDDQILILSTCTYEMNDMRLLVVARKVRDGESTEVDTSKAYQKTEILYPDAWYNSHSTIRPEETSFEEELEVGNVPWYDGGYHY